MTNMAAISYSGNRSYTLFLLTVTYAVAFMDRQIFSILQEQVKHEFQLTDLSLSILSGLPFAFFYGLLAIPVAWFADRTHRVNVIACGFALWSSATIGCGLAMSYLQLMLSRIGVAIGESASLAPSHSIVSNLYAPHERARALGILSTGAGFGMLVGLSTGGWIAAHYGWRVAFFTFGLPGLLLAALVKLTITEPKHGSDAQPARKAGFMATVGETLSNRSTRIFIITHGLAVGPGTALVSWLPSLTIRSFHLSPQAAGLATAAVAAGAVIPGYLLGGIIGDRLVKKTGNPAVLLKLALSCVLIAMPVMIAASWMPTIPLLLLFSFVAMFLAQMTAAPVFSLIQLSIGDHQRAVAAAMAVFGANLVGMALAPAVVGFVSDLSRESFGSNSLRLGLSCSASLLLLAVVSCLVALREAPRLREPAAAA